MTATESLFDRFVGLFPTSARQAVSRFARDARDRLPPVVIERRIEALQRHVDRRFSELDAKLDELLRQARSRAA